MLGKSKKSLFVTLLLFNLLNTCIAAGAAVSGRAAIPIISSLLLDCTPNQVLAENVLEAGKAINATTGNLVTSVLTISAMEPVPSLVILDAPPNSLIILDGINGPISFPNGLVADDKTIVGGGSTLDLLLCDDGSVFEYRVPGQAAVVDGYVVAENSSVISGLSIANSGSGPAIRVTGDSQVWLQDLTVSNTDVDLINNIALPDGDTLFNVASAGIVTDLFQGGLYLDNVNVEVPSRALLLSPAGDSEVIINNSTLSSVGSSLGTVEVRLYSDVELIASIAGTVLSKNPPTRQGQNGGALGTIATFERSSLILNVSDSQISGSKGNKAIRELLSLGSSKFAAEFINTDFIGGSLGGGTLYTGEAIDDVISAGFSQMMVSIVDSTILSYGQDAIEDIRSRDDSTLNIDLVRTPLTGGFMGQDQGIDDLVAENNSELRIRFIDSLLTTGQGDVIQDISSKGKAVSTLL